jgi:hypothetical protein
MTRPRITEKPPDCVSCSQSKTRKGSMVRLLTGVRAGSRSTPWLCWKDGARIAPPGRKRT